MNFQRVEIYFKIDQYSGQSEREFTFNTLPFVADEVKSSSTLGMLLRTKLLSHSDKLQRVTFHGSQAAFDFFEASAN